MAPDAASRSQALCMTKIYKNINFTKVDFNKRVLRTFQNAVDLRSVAFVVLKPEQSVSVGFFLFSVHLEK